jgi:hypothetical protein
VPEYSFKYQEIQNYEVLFDCDTKWDAEGIMDMVEDGEIDPANWKHANSLDSDFKIVIDRTSLIRTDGEEV